MVPAHRAHLPAGVLTQPHDVVLAAVREMLFVVTAGVAFGVTLLPVSDAAVRATVSGLPSPDSRFVVLAVVMFTACAVASAYLPARRAGRVDPAVALRAE